MTALVLLLISALQIFCVMAWQQRLLISIADSYARMDRDHAQTLRTTTSLPEYFDSATLLWPPRMDHAAPGRGYGHRAPIFCELKDDDSCN